MSMDVFLLQENNVSSQLSADHIYFNFAFYSPEGVGYTTLWSES